MRKIQTTLSLSLFTSLIILLNSCGNSKHESNDTDSTAVQGTISLSGAFALYPLANKWAEEFNKTYPDVRFNISAGGAGKGMADALADAVDLGMLSRDIKEEEKNKGAWPIPVTKDAVIATVNPGNTSLSALKDQGLSQDELRKIFITNEITIWGKALGTANNEKINVYTRSDASGAAATWAQYLGAKEQEELHGIGVFGDPGLADAVKKDVNSIGFNNVIYIYDLSTKKKYAGIDVIPIDVNGDNKIAPEEQFYDTVDQLMAAIADGRYPSPPARELYFVSNGKPKNEVVKIFLNWVLTEGQKYVTETGYIKLSPEKIKSEIDKLNESK